MGIEKIKTREEISSISELAKQQGKIVVTANGCFDLLHLGHLDFLEKASKQGDILIVGLNSDESVKSYKGDRRPIIPEEQRARTVASLEFVDYVNIYPETDCTRFVDSIRPNVHVNDSAYGEECLELEVVRKHGGRIHLIKHEINISTTDIIKKIKEL